MGALAATIELDRVRRYDVNGGVASPGGLSDVLFLQQMYKAGAAPYFDVLAMQGYGLWSGPTDRRMQPRVLNFSRPLYIREVMVRNGDAHKPIWLSELGWNSVPPESGLPPLYGQVTEDQQARYAALAYQRMQQEWPWLGVGFYWFFKQADEQERDTNPQYYFRMVEPDFTPLPVYDALKVQAHQPPVMYPGHHQAGHWAVSYQGDWEPSSQTDALNNQVWRGQPGEVVTFTFVGSDLSLIAFGPGQIRVTIDQAAPVQIELNMPPPSAPSPVKSPLTTYHLPLTSHLPSTHHQVRLEVSQGSVSIAGYLVENRPNRLFNRLGSVLMVVATLVGGWVLWRRGW
jgi:hypothetical protein